MTITVNHYHHFPHEEHNSSILNQINTKLNLIMSKATELQEQVTELQVSVDTLQAKVQAYEDAQDGTIAGLNQVISDLTDQVAASGSPAELQAVLDQVVALKADVESTVVPDGSTTTTTSAPVEDTTTEAV
jgi:predicted  nucleic acid-binding Zn-ribbon protein